MLDPRELFEMTSAERPPLDRPVLIVGLGGFIDAGNAGRLAREHLLGTLAGTVIATFDVDQVYDYRARRPPMLFVEDHWESYTDPSLAVHLLTDAAGTPFLLLDGPEPDVQWERFVAAVRLLIADLDVSLTVGFNAIPMGVPHTRPVGVTAHANRSELIADYQSWIGTVQVPASATHLLEFRLGQAGQDVVGLAAHVPHYLTQVDYPAAAQVIIDNIARVSGLSLPTDALGTAAAEVRADIDAQVADSAEVAAVVLALEGQYDAFVGAEGRTLLAGNGGPLPTADEIAAELEKFLADQEPREGPA